MNNLSVVSKGAAVSTLVGVSALASLWWAIGSGSDARAEVTFRSSEASGAAVLTPDDAIAQAEQKVGFDVRVPDDVPAGFTMRDVHAEVGPVGPDQTGAIRDLSHIRTVTVTFKDDSGTSLVIAQQAPESTTTLAGSRPIDSGAAGTKAEFLERPGVTHLIWDSADATYRLTLAWDEETVARDGEATLLSVARSMRRTLGGPSSS